ncbi:DUF38 domain-containing protein [Caenorhabditis elegans]|uniref:DUF38 domain-containing protein n=1 Tax=Caenorhabditis elegans TaxID=6239 RepID=G5EE30_CAEEL|nr:DUF38 domain-containing protein [Caenorhabditis elegans]CAO82049.3 DUF38 domain-containing protein [Caenorhabditis elegans]|eukprot:NP_001346701.1 Uncharacterized protein CELE_Y6G8.8 [Caenorhabditis elegans]
MEASNVSDLMFLKDHFVRSEVFCDKFILQCYFNVDDVIGVFGTPGNSEYKTEKWYFTSQSGDNDICMQHGYFGSESFSSFTFTKVSLDVKLNEKLKLPSENIKLNLMKLANQVQLVMTLIIEKSTFPTLLALRDTSKDLRYFVVKNGLYCSPIEIKVHANTIQCTYNIDDQITFPCSETQSLKKWLKKYCPKHVTIEKFSCDSDNFAKMEDLKAFLLSFKTKMAIENLDLEGKSELEFIELMRYLDEKNLKRLKISFSGDHDNNTNHCLMLDQITETAHWKHAVELILEGSKIAVSIRKLNHFLKVTAFLDVITVENVVFLKHTLLPSLLPRNFNLITPTHSDLQSLAHHIGCPVVKKTNGIEYNQWLFPATKFFEILIHKTINGCTCIEMRHRNDKSQFL